MWEWGKRVGWGGGRSERRGTIQTPNSGLRHISFRRQVPESGVRSVGTIVWEWGKGGGVGVRGVER